MALFYSVTPIFSHHRQTKFKDQNLLTHAIYSGRSKAVSHSFYRVRCEASEGVVVGGPRQLKTEIKLPKDFKRNDFPSDFKFGATTSAIQTEGLDCGRGKAAWDPYYDDGKGVNSYNLYKDDVKLLKAMGVNAYHFSIAWPRILPKGAEEYGSINQEGINFYKNFIEALHEAEIEPVITLFHDDLPQSLQEKYGGFEDFQIVEHFKRYADICFDNFGDQVKLWSTINEPMYAMMAVKPFGTSNPTLQDELTSKRVNAVHNIILAHAAAAKLYRDKYQQTQNGKIGISLGSKWYLHYLHDLTDVSSREKHLDYRLGWFLNPLVNGDYPMYVKEGLRPPKFTKDQKKMLKNSCDFIGVNHYGVVFSRQNFFDEADKGKIMVDAAKLLANDTGAKLVDSKSSVPLFDLLLHIKEKYPYPELYITENGYADAPRITASPMDTNADIEEWTTAILDDKRIANIEECLGYILEAIKKGANVRGYFVRSLMDNVTFCEKLDRATRFGLYFTDHHDNYKRYPKKSAKWFEYFLTGKIDDIKQ